MRSPEAPHVPKAKLETPIGLATATAAALFAAACERIPQTPIPHSAHERIEQTGIARTPINLLTTILPVERAEHPNHVVSRAVLSLNGDPRVHRELRLFNQLALTTYGDHIKATQEVSGYLNHLVIPFQAPSPETLTGRRVSLTFHFTNTSLVDGSMEQGNPARRSALIVQRTTADVIPGTFPRTTEVQHVAQVEAGSYTDALTEALGTIAQPPTRRDIETEFQQRRDAAEQRKDPNLGAQCGVVTDPTLPRTSYCTMNATRITDAVLDHVEVADVQTSQRDGGVAGGGVRVTVFWHTPDSVPPRPSSPTAPARPGR